MRNAGTISRSSSRNFDPAPGRGGRSRSDKALWLAVFALLAAGLVMVYSSSFIFAQERYHDGLFFFRRHLLFIGVGLSTFALGWRLPVEVLRRHAFLLLACAGAALVGALVPGLSHRTGGASRWISLFGFTFQPSEIAKPAVILFVAAQISRKISRQDNFRSGFLTYFISALPIYALLLLQPDFGTVALLLCTTFCMLLAAGVRPRYLITTVSFLIPAATILIAISPYRRARVLSFLDPWSDPARKGFQVIQSFIAFFSGRWTGVGLGNSREKLFYLPEAHNDFIFAVVGEELGLIGVMFFVALFLVVVWRGLNVAQRTDAPFERATAAGIACCVGLQAFFNMGVVLGLLPTKGLPLPLISYGGTSLIMTLFMLGLLAQLSERPT